MKQFLQILAFLLATAVAEAKVWRVNNQPAAVAAFTDLSAAVASPLVQNGDTLYVEGSAANYGFVTLTKKLVLIGPGYALAGAEPNPNMQATPLEADVNIIIDSTASGSLLMGLKGQVSLAPSVDDIQIKRCKFYISNAGSYTTGQRISNLLLSQSIFQGYNAYSFVFDNVQVINCIITGYVNIKTNATLALFRNNTITNATLEADNAYIANNVFYNANLFTTNSVIKYNVANAGTLPAGTGNLNWQSNIIVGTGSEDGKYMLKAGSPALAAGEPIGGETPDCGAFGTADPYRLSGIPPIPAIYMLDVPTSIPSNATTMSIKLSTRSNN
jgi:hypothetical protein